MKYAIWFSVVVSVFAAFIAPALGAFWSYMNDRACLGRPIIFDGMVIGHTRKVNIGADTFWVYRLIGSFDEPKGFHKWETLAILSAHEEWEMKNWLERLEASRYQR